MRRKLRGIIAPQYNGRIEATAILNATERRQKRKLFDCYPMHRAVLASFTIDVERYRVAPGYNFRAPPHSGALYYEI